MAENFLKVKQYTQPRGVAHSGSKIISIGGGKGGAGKSFVSSNLAIFLSNMGFKTLLIDLDLGSANIHTCLGLPAPAKGLHEFVTNPHAQIGDVVNHSQFPNLSYISGANDALDIAQLSIPEQTRLMSAIFNYPSDYVILDLSAGTTNLTLDFFIMATEHLITVTPEPSSIENAYRFMKAAFYRKIKRFERQLGLQETLSAVMNDGGKYKIKTPADLINYIATQYPREGRALQEAMNTLHYKLVLNQVRSKKDIIIGQSMVKIARRYFGFPVDFLGHIDYDNTVWQAVRKRKPLLLESPHSPVYTQILSISRDLTTPPAKKKLAG